MAETQYVSLSLAAETFAVSVSLVREILDYADPFRLPGAPAHLLGLIEVRGTPVPVISLRRRFGLPDSPVDEATRILVIEIPRGGDVVPLGLMADRVCDVLAIEPSDCTMPWTGNGAGCISGVVRRGGQFVAILDVVKLLADQIEATAA
jgi:purine-binding chemotaxis protein CheW